MKYRILNILLFLTTVSGTINAAAPAGYYSSLTGKSTSALKTALYQIINPHTEVSSYNNLPAYFRKTDIRDGHYWWDMYSSMDVDVNTQFGTYMNREHSLPKSWWGGLTDIPAYIDLNHLYPGEAKANQQKSNYPLGEIKAGTTPTFDNGVSKVGTGVNSGGAAKVFEPANEYKGDFARTYFYMVTCYQNMNWTTTWQVMNGTYPSLQSWAIDLLLKWHRADPVSQKEIDRNEEVFKIQNNRNPFIDDPELVEYIWGNKKGQAYQPGTTTDPSGEASLITPVNGMYLDFGQVAIGSSITSRLIFRGENLSGSFDVGITGMNRSLFSLSTNNVPASQANTVAGSYATITYTPNALGSHTAQANISGGGLGDFWSAKVYLTGECLPVPTLTQLTAVQPDSITGDSYIARWDAPADDEVVDYYVVTVKRYSNGDVTTTEYPAEADSLLIDGLSQADYDTYAVQSVRLEHRSPMSNFVTVRPASAINDVYADEPLVVEAFDGTIRFRCSNPHRDVRILDPLGRTVALIPQIDDYYEYVVPSSGIYFIVSASHPRPIKVYVQ